MFFGLWFPSFILFDFGLLGVFKISDPIKYSLLFTIETCTKIFLLLLFLGMCRKVRLRLVLICHPESDPHFLKKQSLAGLLWQYCIAWLFRTCFLEPHCCWVWISVLSLTSHKHVTINKLLRLSVPQFLYLTNNNCYYIYFRELLRRFNEYLAFCKSSVNIRHYNSGNSKGPTGSASLHSVPYWLHG